MQLAGLLFGIMYADGDIYCTWLSVRPGVMNLSDQVLPVDILESNQYQYIVTKLRFLGSIMTKELWIVTNPPKITPGMLQCYG